MNEQKEKLSRSHSLFPGLLFFFALFVLTLVAIYYKKDKDVTRGDTAISTSAPVNVVSEPYRPLPADLDHGRKCLFHLGYISFEVVDRKGPMDRWGNYIRIVFYDEGYDGTLDYVLVQHQNGTTEIIRSNEARVTSRDANGMPTNWATWKDWEERYRYVRTAATHGKYYQE